MLLDETLFLKTVQRLKPIGQPWVITVSEMRELTESGLKDAGAPTDQVIYEPYGKNTAAAVALLCKRFDQLGKAGEIVGVFPADHLVTDSAEFELVVRKAEKIAAEGHVVTIGIMPTYPATGYGYIETAEAFEDEHTGAKIAKSFREKPNENTACEFLERGCFFWNAGMFIFRVSTMIELFQKYAPEIWKDVDALRTDNSNIEAVYKAVKSTSIDYAIMEKLPSHVCLPCSLGWSDLGSWDSMAEVLAEEVNAPRKIEVEGSKNFVYTNDKTKTFGFVGVDNLIVVETNDALLITRKGETEYVKQLVDKLKNPET
ncbi:MAG: hypothetical protein EOP06_00745 [Proteobacteria bacterium]|nr:MAG: hypothetical protein EOP06_00745 [Pseudomonadota bacterium]